MRWKTLLSLMLISGSPFLFIRVSPAVDAVPASAKRWKSAIFYFNPSDSDGSFTLDYYSAWDGLKTSVGPLNVVSKQSGSLLVGDTFGSSAFAGSAVAVANVPLTVIYRQVGAIAPGTAPVSYTAFSDAQAGNGTFYLPRIKRAAASGSRIAVQNLESGDINMTVYFHPRPAGAVIHYPSGPVKSMASAIIDVSHVPGITAPWAGPAVITATKAGDSSPARIVAATEEVPAAGPKSFAYGGRSGKSSTVFVPLAMCETAFKSTYYEVQNTGTSDATVKVDYYFPGKVAGVTTVKRLTRTIGAAAPGESISFKTCRPIALKGKRGVSAVISGADASLSPAPIAAVARLVQAGIGPLNAFAGQEAPMAGGDGKYRVAIPYVEWAGAAPGYRTFITIQNTDAAAGDNVPVDVNVTYYNTDGSAAATSTLKELTRFGTNPSKAGIVPPGGSFSGAAVVECDKPIAAVVRVQKLGSVKAADGYTGIPLF